MQIEQSRKEPTPTIQGSSLFDDDSFLSSCDGYEIYRVFDEWEYFRKHIFQEGGNDEIIPLVPNQVHKGPTLKLNQSYSTESTNYGESWSQFNHLKKEHSNEDERIIVT